MTKKDTGLPTKTGLGKEIERYVDNGDTLTAKNLLKNLGKQIKGFDCEKYVKLIKEAENRPKK